MKQLEKKMKHGKNEKKMGKKLKLKLIKEN